MRHTILIQALVSLVLAAMTSGFAQAKMERFTPRQKITTEIWRLTNDPNERHHANYHNAQCFSPDGRYICYYDAVDLYIYDLHLDRAVKVDSGRGPRWAQQHNWLFYTKPGAGVMWFDADSRKTIKLSDIDMNQIGGISCDDQWLFGGVNIARLPQESQGYRIRIQANSTAEKLEGLKGIQWMPNPVYPVVYLRYDYYQDPIREQDWGTFLLTYPSRIWFDLDGGNPRTGSPQIQRSHQSWLGNGEYHLHGGTPMAGRKWNEPFPSNLNFLAAVSCGDVSPCGRNGRWICGSSNFGPMQLADLRSGDGWNYLEAALSLIHDASEKDYSNSSALHDNDSKGSADGTKICFVSNYDLKAGPITHLTDSIRGNSIEVESTAGFPEKGHLSLIPNEVIAYSSKTATSFEGIQRNVFAHSSANPSRGKLVSSFEARCIPVELRKEVPLPYRKSGYKKEGNPLVWQRQTDVYVAVIRNPDPPALRLTGNVLELIPGENHWETHGYQIFRNGKQINSELLLPGTSMDLPDRGAYTAVAVEWSGLKSAPCASVSNQGDSRLRVLQEKPDDFAWTTGRWLVNCNEVEEALALKATSAVREIDHRLDGEIHREWYDNGILIKRHDLNVDGKAVRRLFYSDKRLVRREYHNREGEHVSTEHFDKEGYITESIVYRNGEDYDHFWYDKGMPVKHTGRNSHHAGRTGTQIKVGERWVQQP